MEKFEDKNQNCQDPRDQNEEFEIIENSETLMSTSSSSDQNIKVPDWLSIQTGEELWGKIFKAQWYKEVVYKFRPCIIPILQSIFPECQDISAIKDFKEPICQISSESLRTLKNKLSVTFTDAWMAEVRSKKRKLPEDNEETTQTKKTPGTLKRQPPPSEEKPGARSIAISNTLLQELPFIGKMQYDSSCGKDYFNNQQQLSNQNNKKTITTENSEDKNQMCKDPRDQNEEFEIIAEHSEAPALGIPTLMSSSSDQNIKVPDWLLIQTREELWEKIYQARWWNIAETRHLFRRSVVPILKTMFPTCNGDNIIDFKELIDQISSKGLRTLKSELSNKFTDAWMADVLSKKRKLPDDNEGTIPQKQTKKTPGTPKGGALSGGKEPLFIGKKNDHVNSEKLSNQMKRTKKTPAAPKRDAPSAAKRAPIITTSNILSQDSPLIWKKRCDNMYTLKGQEEHVLQEGERYGDEEDSSYYWNDYSDIEQLLEFLKGNSKERGAQFLAFDNIDEVLNISTEEVISCPTDPALSSSKFRKEQLLTQFFDRDLYFYELMSFYETLVDQWIGYISSHSSSDPSNTFSLVDIDFNTSLIYNINFQEVKQEFMNVLNADNQNNDLMVLVRQFNESNTHIYLVIRKFNDVVKTTFFIRYKTDVSCGSDEVKACCWPVVLQLTREEGDSQFDDLVSCNLMELSYDSLCQEATKQFKQIANCSFQFYYNDELVQLDASLERYFASDSIPTFVIKLPTTRYDKGKLEEEKLLSITSNSITTLPIFRSQQLIASTLFEKAKEILNNKEFNAFSFIIFVPKYNTLRQQTIDRLGCFHDLVAGMTEKELTDRVILYPQTKSSSRIVDKFKKDIHENPDTLFVILVDECHYAPTLGAIDLLHDRDINENKHQNILTLLVSATPFNTLSKTSRICRENVINWSDIIHADLPDSYVGFEYFARSLAFIPSEQPELIISTIIGEEESIHVVYLPNRGVREYFGYDALTNELNVQLHEVLPNLSIVWDKKMEKFKISYKSQVDNDNDERKIIILYNEFMKSLGFAKDIEINTKRGAPTFSENNVTIDCTNPVKYQLIRSDEHFVTLRELLERKFPFLKRATTGEKDVVTGKRKNKTLNSVSKSSELIIYGGEQVESRVRKAISTLPITTAGPATVKNGYIIVLDYILSIVFYACFRDLNSRNDVVDAYDVSPAIIECYLERLYLSCFHIEDGELFNLVDMLNVILDRMISDGKELLQNKPNNSYIPWNSLDVVSCLKMVLEEKIAAYENKDITIETETWFTETDRIVFNLMDSKRTAPIVLLRCYDNDENRSMQKILRHSLEVCKLATKNGERPFSIIGDISGTRILNEIEPYFLKLKIEHQEFQRCKLADVPKLRSLKLQQDASSSDLHLSKSKLVINDDIKYEDLRGIKCLLILCEKGRMGDTFPHNLMVLDLRLRTCRAGSGFIQEMGRMCRYPRYTEAVDEIRLQSLVDQLDHMDAVLEHPGFENLFSNGCIMFNKHNQSFVGLARSGYQFKRLLEQKNRNISDYSFHNLSSPLPYALIDKTYLEEIYKAGDKREVGIFATHPPTVDYEVQRNKNRILEHLSCPYGIDDYVDQKEKKPSADFLYSLSRSKEHYDLNNADKLFNRMLLKAECQIGKTGAFLAFLYLLNASINSCPRLPPNIVPKTFGYQWHIPYWHNLTVLKQPRIEYGKPKLGKYHSKVLMQRASLLKSMCATSTATVAEFIDRLIEVECIQVSSALTLLNSIVDRFKQNAVQLSKIFHSPHYLKELLNWDGRMNDKTTSNGQAFEELVEKLQGERGVDIVPSYNEENYLEHWIDATDDLEEDINENAFNGETFKPSDVPLQIELSNEGQEACSAKSLLQRFSDRDDEQWKVLHPVTWNDEEQNNFRVSVPAAFDKLFGPLVNIDDMRRIIEDYPRIIKNWIFTPSYSGRSRLGEKLLMRADCFPNLEMGKDYIQVLVVQKDQFDSYAKYYGAQYIIVELPEFMYVDIISGRNGTTIPKKYLAKTGGVGYARRFIQEFATYYLGLKAIWMLDDNIKACYRLSIPRDSQPVRNDSSNQLKYEATSFEEVMLSVEKICELSSSTSSAVDIQLREESLIKAPDGVFRNAHNIDGGKVSNYQDYIGSTEKAYGIIGIGRSLNQYQLIKEPIKVTHSVYSFFWFNLEAAAKYNLYYSPRPIWEDIEMIHMMEEKDLVVCKLQMFSHYKPPHGLRKPFELPKQPVPLIESSRFCDLISEFDRFKIIVFEKEQQQSHPDDRLLEVREDLVEFYSEHVIFCYHGRFLQQDNNTESLIILNSRDIHRLSSIQAIDLFLYLSLKQLEDVFGQPPSAKKIIFIVPPFDLEDVAGCRELSYNNNLCYDVNSSLRIAGYIVFILTRKVVVQNT